MRVHFVVEINIDEIIFFKFYSRKVINKSLISIKGLLINTDFSTIEYTGLKISSLYL